jgi:K(+)-stimulated pyrophosphate-energized sodium pump
LLLLLLKREKMVLQSALIISICVSALALGYALLRARWIYKQPAESEALRRISGYVARGAMTFLAREYRVLIPFIVITSAFLALVNRGYLSFQALTFALGAACSALAGFIGMKVATASNSRTTHAAQRGIAPALRISFAGGSIMGLCVVGLALFGIFLVLAIAVFSPDFRWAPHPSPCLQGSVVVSIPKLRILEPIWWASWRLRSPRMTPGILPP